MLGLDYISAFHLLLPLFLKLKILATLWDLENWLEFELMWGRNWKFCCVPLCFFPPCWIRHDGLVGTGNWRLGRDERKTSPPDHSSHRVSWSSLVSHACLENFIWSQVITLLSSLLVMHLSPALPHNSRHQESMFPQEQIGVGKPSEIPGKTEPCW